MNTKKGTKTKKNDVSKLEMLTLETIEKLSSDYEQTESFQFDQYRYEVDKHIRQSKFDNMLYEFRTLNEKSRNEKEDENSSQLIDIAKLVHILIIKYFANIPIPDNTTYDQYMLLYKSFYDMGLMTSTLESIGDEKLNLIADNIKKQTEALKIIQEDFNKALNKDENNG